MADKTLSDLTTTATEIADTDLLYVSVDDEAGGFDSAKITGANLFGSAKTTALGITVDGSGSVLETGVKGFLVVPFDCTITGWTVTADQSGSVQFDVWKSTYGSAPPTDSDAIGTATLSSAQFASGDDAGWTTAINATDVVGFYLDSATTVTRATLTIEVRKA